MNDFDEKQLGKILKNAIEPVGERALQKDLWHRVQVKLPQPGFSVPVFDWVLAALAIVLSLLAPEALWGLLAHL